MLCCPTYEQHQKLDGSFAIRPQPSWLWTPASPLKIHPSTKAMSLRILPVSWREHLAEVTRFECISLKEPKVGTGKSMKKWCHTVFVWLFGLYSQLSEMFCLPNLLVSVCTPNHGQNLTVQVDVFSKYIGPIDSWTFRHGRSGYLAYLEFSKQPAGFGIVWMSFWAGFCLLLKVPSFQNGPFRMMNS